MLKRNKKTKIILSIALFSIVFICLGLLYPNWWFFGCDDFHAIFLAHKTKTLNDLFYFFCDGHTNQYATNPNNPTLYIKPNFLGTYYRPLYLIYFTLQYWIFKTNIYYFLLTSTFFHAINTVLLFNIFLYFINIYPAFLTTLLFAFHPQIAYRFGAIVNTHYYINVTLMLLTILFFKKYLDSKKLLFYFSSTTCFTLSLFTRESSIILPAIISLGYLIYEISVVRHAVPAEALREGWERSPLGPFDKTQDKLRRMGTNAVKTTSVFWTISLSFLLLRLYLYPLSLSPIQPKSITLLSNIKIYLINKLPQIQVFLYDFFWLSFLPWGHKITKGLILLTLISLLIFLFIKNNKKIYILYFLICTFLMLWPGLAGTYSPRYFYEAAPFALLAFIFLFNYSKINSKILNKIFITFLSFFVLFLIIFNIKNFKLREEKLGILQKATIKLLNNPIIKNRNLAFIAYPIDGISTENSGIYKILFDNPNLKFYFDSESAIIQADSHFIKTEKFYNIISSYYSKNYVEIKPIKNGFNFKTINPQKVFFEFNNPEYSLGKKIINKKDLINNNKLVITDFDLIINQNCLDKNPLFIKWDYEKQGFEIIN